MRKFCFLFLVTSMILLMVSFSLAQPPRQATSSEGKTSFTNIAVIGLNKDGTGAYDNQGLPGYIEMTSAAGSVFYLYIGSDSNLRIASERAVGYLASPATVGWADASGPIVGNQS